MEHLVKDIETMYGRFNFYLNEIETPEGKMYHVSVVGKDKKLCMFVMEKHFNRWYIKNPVHCPDWIINIEPMLSDEIVEAVH